MRGPEGFYEGTRNRAGTVVKAPTGMFLRMWTTDGGPGSRRFDWGNKGKASGQLAYAILRDRTGDHDFAEGWWECFRDKIIDPLLDDGNFMLHTRVIDEWIENAKGESR